MDVRVAPPKVAVIVTGVETITVVVPIAKFALTAPAVTVTLAGTLATGALLLDSPTMAPPLGAAAVNVTVPVDPAPPVTLVGLTVTEVRLGAAGTGVTVSTAERETPPKVPEIDNAVEPVTGVVVMVKLALVAPAGTVALAGTPATAVLLLARVTVAPAARAAALSVIVPVEDAPPATVEGLTASAEMLRATSPKAHLVTKASPQKISVLPLKITSSAPGVVGKSAEYVTPVT